MPKFDVPIKRLVQRCSHDWIQFLLPEVKLDQIIPLKTETTPVSTSRLDEAFEIKNEHSHYFLHFEPQVYYQDTFPIRMLRYRADLWEALITDRKYLLPIRQIAIFLYPEHENKNHNITDEWNGQLMINYTYKVIRLWEFERRHVIEKKLFGLYPLLPLMQEKDDEDPEAVVQETVEVIHTVEDHALKMDLFAVFGIIGGNKYAPELIRTYVRRELLMESPIYNEWVEEERREALEKGMKVGREIGREEGKEEGKAEGKEEGKAEGKAEAKYEFAKELIKEGFRIEMVMKLSKLTKEEVEKLL